MNMTFRSCVLMVLALLALRCTAQEAPIVIKLTIKYGGEVQPDPSHVGLAADHQAMRLQVKNDRFGVPAKFSVAKSLGLTVDTSVGRIRISNLPRRVLEYDDWTLVLANHGYDEDYAWAVPKGADIRSSCILVLDSVNKDPGSVIFQTHCRSKRPVIAGTRKHDD